MKKPLILITNDDGITSKGIFELILAVKDLGEIIVVAPAYPQSGMGHAITVGDTLKIKKSQIFKEIEAYECSGTPADCVKLAKYQILKGRRVDLLLSGINHGSNTSINVLYSGTMGAAIEGAIEGTSSIGFSLCDYDPKGNFSHGLPFVVKIVKEVLRKGLPKNVALNVNIPAMSDEQIKGIKICRQANNRWQEDFDLRIDPYGRDYYWMVGKLINNDKGEDHDEWAIKNNYLSIVPCQFDLTSYQAIAEMNADWNF